MKFKLDTSGNFYEPEKAERLKALGFRFEPDSHRMRGEGSLYKISDINGEGDLTIDISTLEELVAFSREWGRLIFSEEAIEIYDDYRE